MFSFSKKKVKPYTPPTLTNFLDQYASTQNRQEQLNSLTAVVKGSREGKLSSSGITPSEENEILKRFKDHGYQDGLEKRPMNQEVLNKFSLTTDYRYADSYGKGYKQGKEKAISLTKYGGRKTQKHHKASKKTMKKKSRKHRK
jgi:hypothetical protein